MSEAARARHAEQLLEAGREHTAAQTHTELPPLDPTAVQLPGTKSPGGIDAMLAPRTADQQAAISAHLEARREDIVPAEHVRNEHWRRLPVVGGWIANLLHGRLLNRAQQRRITDRSTRY